jgi:hypothetical protein
VTTTTRAPGGPTTTVPRGGATTTIPGPGGPAAPTTVPPRGQRAAAPPLALTGEPSAALVLLASTLTLLGCALVLVSRPGLRRRAPILVPAPDPVDDLERVLADPFFLPAPRVPSLALAGGAPLRSPLAYLRFRNAAATARNVTRGASSRE